MGLLLTLGSNSKVVVMKKVGNSFSEAKRIDQTSDNVSCCKSIYLAESKQVMTMYATYNGRLAYFLI